MSRLLAIAVVVVVLFAARGSIDAGIHHVLAGAVAAAQHAPGQ